VELYLHSHTRLRDVVIMLSQHRIRLHGAVLSQAQGQLYLYRIGLSFGKQEWVRKRVWAICYVSVGCSGAGLEPTWSCADSLTQIGMRKVGGRVPAIRKEQFITAAICPNFLQD